MPTVRIPPVLRPITDDRTQLSLAGSTLGEVLDSLFAEYPALRERMLADDGEIQRFVNVYVDDEDVRTRGGLGTELRDDSSIIILPAMAGGSGPRT